jgi:hypothetical protein
MHFRGANSDSSSLHSLHLLHKAAVLLLAAAKSAPCDIHGEKQGIISVGTREDRA